MEQALEQQRTWAVRGEARRNLVGRAVSDALRGWGLYLTVAIGLALGVLLIYNTTRLVAGNGVQIVSRPFTSTVFWGIAFGLLYVTVRAARSTIRSPEQDQVGAPVGLIGAHLVAGIVVYVLVALFYMPLLWGVALIANLYVPPALLWVLVVSIPIAGLAVSFGLFLSAVSGSSRGALVLLGAATLVVVVIQGGHAALLAVPPADGYDVLLITTPRLAPHA